ncbi:MAG: NADH-quinone oxidoreductase subunit NuoH [bacterium]|nr:NADH-quinone oxidoreductase subunit NuoH [bacterium]
MFSLFFIMWFERKLIGHFQVRLGPMRVGPHGILQPIADGIKVFLKEDLIPANAHKFLFLLAPFIALFTALVPFAVIPFGPQLGSWFEKPLEIFGYPITWYITDINIGILYIFAFSSLSVYALVLAGWSSNSKYSLLGGLRSAAQLISYELAMGLSIVGVVMLSQSLSLVQIVNAQSHLPFIILQPLGFISYLIAAVAETNRSPFDLPEAESELVAGYHTEYSSMKFAMFFIAEYTNMVTLSALATTLFLGGWQGPNFLPPIVWFLLKTFFFIFLYVWLRATLPRFRYDQLMKFGWKVLLPLALANIFLTGIVISIIAN